MDYLMNLEFTNVVWIYVLPLIFMLIDIITGYVNAWEKNSIDSSKMRDGLGKKCAELVYILIGILFKFAFGLDVLMYGIVLYVCYMELNSIAENCAKLGFDLPGDFQKKLKNNNKEDK